MATPLEGLTENDLVAMARQLEAARRYEELAPVLRRLTELAPKSVDYFRRLGWALISLGQHADAEEAFRRAAAVPGRERWEAFGGQGLALAKLERFDDAIPLLKKAVEQGVDRADIKDMAIRVLDQQGRHQDALSLTEKLIKQDPGNSNLLFSQGLLLAKLGRHADAISVQQRALLQNSAPPVAMITAYAETLAAAERWPEAANVLLEVLRESFDDSGLHILLTQCLEKAFPGDSGRAFLEDALSRNPTHAVAMLQLAALHEKLWQLDLAEEWMTRCVSLNPDTKILPGRAGRIAVLRGDYAKAMAFFRKDWDAAAQYFRSHPFQPTTAAREPSDGVLNPIVYLAVEVSSRELQTRLLMARCLVEMGFMAVVLGYDVLRRGVSALPRGMIVYKSLNSLDLGLAALAKSAGHVFTAIDEEAFGYTGETFAVTRTLVARGFLNAEALFAPGEDYKRRVVEEVPGSDSKVRVTGNPRTDLYDPRLRSFFAAEADTMRAELGPSILICTNFGGWNSATLAYGATCLAALGLPGIDPDSAKGQALVHLYDEDAEMECRNTEAIREALGKIAHAFPNHKIIVRPHPVEDLAAWHRFTADLPNAMIAKSGTLQAQMMASDVLVHFSGCGTGLEALLLGTPAINFDTAGDLKQPTYGLSAHTSPAARDSTALVEMLKRAIEDREAFMTEAVSHAALVDACVCRSEELVSQRIAKELRKIYEAKAGQPLDSRRQAGGKLLRELNAGLAAARKAADTQAASSVRLTRAKRLQVSIGQIKAELETIGRQIGAQGTAVVHSPADGIFIAHG